jgi:hypothetical protein
MEGTPIMQVRRRWSPVAEMPANDRGALACGPRSDAAARDRSGVRNPRYMSARVLLDNEQTAPRFPPSTVVDGWRETIRRDPTMRAVLLNPVDYEPR